MGIVRYFITILLVAVVCVSQAQDDQDPFTSGKNFFNNGQYEFAMQTFKRAMEVPGPRAPYAAFYYALSAYRSGYKPVAREAFRSMASTYPRWEYTNESTYWLSLIYFEEGELSQALEASRKLYGTPLEEQVAQLETKYFKLETSEQLEELYTLHPGNTRLASEIVSRYENVPQAELNMTLLESIRSEHGFSIDAFEVPTEPVLKPVYRVAVMFPFIWSNLEASGVHLRKSLVVDLYEGIRMGVKRLQNQGLAVELLVYDTQGDSTITAELLTQPELKQVDLIIGPLTPQALTIVREFSFRNKINMVNPVTNNSEATGNNPFAFMMNPSEVTLGRTAGAYVATDTTWNDIIVYYGERESDKRMAFAFSETVRSDSFNILSIDKVVRDSTEWIFEYLTAKQDLLDSLGNPVYDKDENKIEEMVIKEDSIGSIFVSTMDFKIASEVFSAVAGRGDASPIKIIGHGSWLLDRTANYTYMEDLGITMLAPDYIDFTSDSYLQLERAYIRDHHELPSRFVVAGYDCMLFLGHCLANYGVYFQEHFRTSVIRDAGLRRGYDFRTGNDNQYIPLIWFENLNVQVMDPAED